MYKFTTKVYWGDADAAGIAFFVKHYEFCHRAYEEWLEGIKHEIDIFDNPKFIFPLKHSEADYFNPLFRGDTIDVYLNISDIRNSSYTVNYTIKRGDDLIAILKIVNVTVNRKTMQKANIPEVYRKYLKKYSA